MGHAVAGRLRTDDEGRKVPGQPFIAILFLVVFAGVISCAAPNPSKPAKEITTVVDSAVIGEKEKDRQPPRPLPVNRPVEISFESDPVLYAALSGDGKTFAYVLENEGRSVWLTSTDPVVGGIPQKRLEGMGRISTPALSGDGRILAFTATDHDAKGDIYVLSLDTANQAPRRLTGRESADGAPTLSPDGRRIYFQQLFPGKMLPQLAAMDLSLPIDTLDIPRAKTLREGSFPAVSPNGGSLAFVSFTEDSGGDIWVLDLKSGEAKPITRDASQDLYPTWSVNGKWIYFSRFNADTNGDGIISFIDNAVICRVATEDKDLRVYPLTPETFSAYQPMTTSSRIFFLSNKNGTGNIWALPLSGQIPLKENVQEQMAVARLLASRLPREDSLAVLAYYKVLENFGKDEKSSAKAAYEIGKLYQRMGRRSLAIQTFERVMNDFKDSYPEKVLAAIRLAAFLAENAWEAAPTDVKRKEILHHAIIRIQKISETENAPSPGTRPSDSSGIKARAWITQARLLGDLGQDATSLENAISLLDRVVTMPDLSHRLKAEALFQKAFFSSRMGRASAVTPIYLSIITGYPGTPWADRSIEEIIDMQLSDATHEKDEIRMQALARLAETHRKTAPGLSMGALNRMGDTAFQKGDWPQAKRWFREVLTMDPGESSPKDEPPPTQPPTQLAAARLALAEILYREELFRQALDLYEKEMAYRPYEDRLYGLARGAYVQKSLAAANFLFGLGEIPAAQKIYNDLLREDYRLVQAHRGYIKCAAFMKQIDPVQDRYEVQLANDPDNPVLLYATGLCLTYLEGKQSLDEGRGRIEAAIRKQGQNPYFHQTLGYIFEVSETVYGEPGGLEKALLSYQKASFLNDREADPQNSANLALNLGNIHFLLGQYGKALKEYLKRLESKTPFDHEDTEILFYRRLGGAAFQVNDPAISIDAYTRALELISKRIDPRRPSELMGKLNTTIFDRILTPALKRSKNAENIQLLVREQKDIHKALFNATEKSFGPPPDPRWGPYKQAMGSIMAREEKLIGGITPLMMEKKNETEKTLSFMLMRARDALEFPDRMIGLKVEMLDRLGLAYQEARKWDQAANAFEDAFQLNFALGQTKNLAANRRSVAYNTYMAAGERGGSEKARLLREALKQFRELQGLLDQYGVVDPQEKKAGGKRHSGGSGGAVLNISLDLALDRTSASQAVYGFNREQEKRLAQAFISRIETELGVLLKAQAAIDQQLLPYPQAKTVSHKDLFGVSLMSHRDGQLHFALRQPKEAFQSFQRSAELALELKNPVSAAMNVVNMAWALSRIPSHVPTSNLKSRLSVQDRKTTTLLNRSAEVLDPWVLPDYHNTMGVLMFDDGEPFEPSSPLKAARNLARLKQAGVHFTRGLAAMKGEMSGAPMTRKGLALAAALQLNLAHVALALHEPSSAKIHAGKALEIAKKGLLPQYEWRSLLLLGDLKGALKTLSTVSLMNAGCGPGEIRAAFAGMVSNLVRKDDAEGALNLLENLSEIERFQRMAPMVRARVSLPERILLLKIFPRLMTLLRLKTELNRAEKGEKHHLTERIAQEQALLDQSLGKPSKGKTSSVGSAVALPGQLTRSAALREQLLFLLSLCFEMDRVADLAAAVETRHALSSQEENPFKDRHHELLAMYGQALKVIRKLAIREGTPGVAALFGPYPVETMDLMENLPQEGRAIRFFEKNPKGNSWTAFVVTPDDILVKPFSPDHPFAWSKGDKNILIYETPWALPFETACPVALSATHLVRSVENRKPFKRKIVEIAGAYDLPADFNVTALPASAEKEEISSVLPGVQTLLLGGAVYTANTVPTRPKDVPAYGPAMGLDQGRSLSLFTLFHQLSHTSLVMAPGAVTEETPLLGHLFSLMGVPTVALPQKPLDHSPVVTLFFDAYGKNPVQEALRTAVQNPRARGERWVALGYWGMTEQEALDLATRRFKTYVKEGISSFKKKEPVYALISFENALMVARQTDKLSRYEPQLLIYARESAYAAGRYETAARYAEDLVKFWTLKKPDSRDQAEALVKLGLIHARMEQYHRAIPALEEGAEIMANLELADLQVAALNDLGVVLENATDYDRALSQFQTAAEISESLDKQGRLARQHMRMGRIYDLRMSQYAKAKTHYLKAFALYETLHKTELAQALLDAGRCDRLLGNFKGAEEQYGKALKLLNEGEEVVQADNKILAAILMEQANNHWFQARYQDAFKGRLKVYKMALRNNWTLEQVNSLNTAGLIWWTLGDHPAAIRELEKALVLAKTLHARRDEVATTLNNMGLVYRDAGDYEKALAALDQALAIDRKINSIWAIAYDLKNLGLTRLRMGDAEKAVPLFEEALALAKKIGNRINQAKILVGYGDALVALKRLKNAKTCFDEALDLSHQMVLREVEWRALYGLAKLHLEGGNKEKARTLLEEAIKVIEGMRAEIKLDQLKDGFIANKMAVYESLVSLLVDMGQDSHAFYVAERSRARNLIDLLGNQRLSLHGAVNQNLYDGEKTLKSRIAEYEALMAQATDPDEQAVYRKALDQARDRYRDLMLEIQLKNPGLAAIISVDPLTLRRVQALIEPGTAILAYYLVPHEILCWFITHDQVELFKTPLGRETLAQSVLDYRRTLQNLEPAERESQELYAWLLSPLKERLKGVKTVGIVPHHILHHLSFATLFDGKDYVVDQVPLFSLPSASVLRHTVQNRDMEKSTRVLAVGNPDLKNPALALPFTEKEVASIGWRFPDVTVLTGDKATEGWVVRNISDYGIIHLASHGEFDPVNPLFSSVKLARSHGDDGDLRASEIFGLDIQAGLVMLSACQTGLGKITSGDDVIGMNRAFLYAGTNAIMSSLWRVSDISTALLVKQFYREFKTLGKAESLSRAMGHVKNRFPHPGYWGAFVLVGDYR